MPPNPRPPALTHFLCIPLVTPASRLQLARAVGAFRAEVGSSQDSFGFVPPDAVRPVGTIHLTLGVMSFPRNEGLDRAVALLRSLRPREILASVSPAAGSAVRRPQQDQVGVDTVKNEKEEDVSTKDAVAGSRSEDDLPSMAITLRGLQSMQPALAKASVLYAPPVDPQGVLQAFCEKVRGEFSAAGLLVEDERPLRLHATIVNTVYVRSNGGGGGRRGKRGGERVTIDARGILDRYEDEVWMQDIRVEKLAICRMGAKQTVVDGMEDEEYEVEAAIDM